MVPKMISVIALVANAVAQTTPTYYFRVGEQPSKCLPVQNFNDGQSYGPCNGGQGIKYGPNSKYYVAINGATAHCGQQITMEYNGRSIALTVMDECPSCTDGHVDMSLDALVELTGSAEAACAVDTLPPKVNWYFTSGRSSQQSQPNANDNANSSNGSNGPSPAAQAASLAPSAQNQAPTQSNTPSSQSSIAAAFPEVTQLAFSSSEGSASLSTIEKPPANIWGSNIRPIYGSYKVSSAKPLTASLMIISILLLSAYYTFHDLLYALSEFP